MSSSAISNGLFKNVRQVPSAHYNERPDQTDISLLVIHNISLPPSQFLNNYVEAFFLGELKPSDHSYFESIHELKVSAHLFIQRDGNIIQFVPFHKRAWHAGLSSFNGRDNCNDFSIGIELEGADDIPYTDEQYQQLVLVTRELIIEYSKIKLDHIVGHSDIAPGRKTDPGDAFDWSRYHQMLTSDFKS